MPGPYGRALAAARRPREPEELLSWALIDPPTDVGTYVFFARVFDDPSSYCACHDIADALAWLCTTGAVVLTPWDANDPDASMDAAVAAVQQNGRFVRLKYSVPQEDGHTFSLLTSGGFVEGLEGWAGNPNFGGGVWPCAIHEVVFRNTRRDIFLSQAAAAQALPETRDASEHTRLLGFRKLSRSGYDELLNLDTRVYPLLATGNVTTRVRLAMDHAKRWIYDVRTGQYQVGFHPVTNAPVNHDPDVVCCACLRVFEPGCIGTTVFTRWHRCRTCHLVYCNQCGADLQRPAGDNMARERRCPGRAALAALPPRYPQVLAAPCGGRTELF
jgi:hypothetical protein